jgi:hypothetical protein
MEKLTNLDLARPQLVEPGHLEASADGRLIKIDSSEKEGPGALVITKIHPNLTIIGVAGTGDLLLSVYRQERGRSKPEQA